MNIFGLIPSKKIIFLAVLLLMVAGIPLSHYFFYNPHSSVKLDQDVGENSEIINPSTQSINRQSSVLRELSKINDYQIKDDQFSLKIQNEKGDRFVEFENIDTTFLFPQLLYPHEKDLDEFDRANLMLYEFSRSGIMLANNDQNELFGFYSPSDGLFNDGEEYFYDGENIKPNPGAKPVRVGLTNNCLKSGLWEISAKDSVGEMYHSWFNFDKNVYYDIIREVNSINSSDFDLFRTLRYKKDIENVQINLDKIREKKGSFLVSKATVNAEKATDGYSSQDSRRKAQRKYYKIYRDGEQISAKYTYELESGDTFRMRGFVPPGVYTSYEREFEFNPWWGDVQINSVKPLTSFKNSKVSINPEDEYIELILFEKGNESGIILGNIPVDLLVEQEDYRIHGFGVGIPPTSELIERRFLRTSNGPPPAYAYQFVKKDGDMYMRNNHEHGIDQVAIRAIRDTEGTKLSVTLIGFERIVDMLEVHIPITGELEKAIDSSISAYRPPLYRVYTDNAVL